MHHCFVRVNYLVYSRENVSLVDVHSESYVFYQKARHSFLGEKMTHVNKIKCCMG